MLFSQYFNRVEARLREKCLKLIIENAENRPAFKLWLKHEADLGFGRIYQTEFKREFGARITEGIQEQLWYAAKNLIYMITAYVDFNTAYDVKDLLKLADGFMTEQLDAFDTDFDIREWTDLDGYMIESGDPC
jgi:hypothetical protein